MDKQLNPPSQSRLFTTIRSQYSTQVLQLARSLIRLRTRLARQKQQLTFNIRCKHLQLLPRSLCLRPMVKTPEGYRIARQTGFRFLRARINENTRNIKSLSHISILTHRLNSTLSAELFASICSYVERMVAHESNMCKTRLKRKIDVMLKRRREVSNLDERWVVNLSTKD